MPRKPGTLPEKHRMVRAAGFYAVVVVAVILLGLCVALAVLFFKPDTPADIASQSLVLDTKGQITVSSRIQMTASATIASTNQYILNIQLSQLNSEPWQLENRVLDTTQSSLQVVTDLSKVAGLLAAPATLTATWSIYNHAGKAFITKTASVSVQVNV